jgi:fructose-1,6-bisphosphatase/inositol monophosphatase family enzyme
MSEGLDDDLAFTLALAARAGEVLMDRYERLERIDYKSARDVVTEADHESEALISTPSGASTRPTRSWPRRPASTTP